MKDLIERIRFLEHLSYLIECLSLDYTGEAKTEFSGVIVLFDKIENVSEDEIEISDKLKLAKDLLSRGDSHQSAGYLSQISRQMWSSILKQLPK